MTPLTSTARITTTASTTTDAEKLLRDMAYILKLTRRVKEEMCADRAQAQAPVTNPERALVA